MYNDHKPGGRSFLRVLIVGCGHIGLVMGGCLAAIGHQVTCADRDAERIRLLERGELPFYEAHLDNLIQRGRSSGALTFTSDLNTGGQSEVAFLCVGVAQSEDGESDFSALDRAALQLARAVEAPGLVIERGTVPVQTGEQLKRLLFVYSRNRQAQFRVAANPQLLREGTAVENFFHPDRILLGVEDADSERVLRQIYAPILEGNCRCPIHSPTCPPGKPPELLVTSVRSAELIKQTSNAFLCLKISYANALADLCERLGADVQEVTHAVGLDSRIGTQFLDVGIGFGGSRLPSDLRALCRLVERVGVDAGILRAAENVNRSRIDVFFEKAKRSLWVLKDKRIALLGLAHKANTDDVRCSPAIELVKRLTAAGAWVRVYDPQAMANARAANPGLVCCSNVYDAAERADGLLIATEWDEFRVLDWVRIRDMMMRPLVIDGRNVLSPAEMKALGFEYHSVGR